METFLIIVLIALWLYQYQRISKRLDDLVNRNWNIERLLDEMSRKTTTATPAKQEAETAASPHTEEVIAKVPEPPPVFTPVTEPEPVVSSFKTLGYYETENIETTPEEEGITPLPETELQMAEQPEEADWWQQFRAENQNLEKFIGENLLSKIGIAILVLGIGFFVKYAIDKEWIGEVARVGIGVLAGGIVLGFAHKLREEFKAFSSVLVAGGISIFYFTLAIAFHEYALFSQTVAFALMSVVTVFSVLISMNYNRQELAILALIGGFATPLMVSTGSGNYKVLFTYLLILDGGMLLLSAYREWKWVNILTFVFTLLFYASWSARILHGTEEHLGTFWFGVGFYLVFTVSNLIYPIRKGVSFDAYAYSLMLMNTAVFYGLGMALLDQSVPAGKGAFTLAMSVIQLALTYTVRRSNAAESPLFYVMLGLTLTFATLIAPVQLEGNYITLFWAAESALLIWLASRSKMEMYRLGSLITAFLACVSLFMDWMKFYGNDYEFMIVFNKVFMTGIFAGLALAAGARFQRKDNDNPIIDIWGVELDTRVLTLLYHCASALVIYGACMLELNYQLRTGGMALPGVYEFLLAMHMLFCGVLVYIVHRSKKEEGSAFNVIVAGVNLLLFIFMVEPQLENLFDKAVVENYLYASPFYVHFLSLGLLAYQFLLTYPAAKKLSTQITAWVMVTGLTIVLSQEVMAVIKFVKVNTLIGLFSNAGDSLFILEELQTTIIKSIYPVLWGGLAFVLLSIGIKRRYKELRVVSLILIGITILKLFVYDIRNASEGGKIAAFILLGLVLLVISFTYQKIKAILIDEDENGKVEE